MARLTLNRKIEVITNISKDELMAGLREITIYDKDFNPDQWSSGEAADLAAMSKMILREHSKKVAVFPRVPNPVKG